MMNPRLSNRGDVQGIIIYSTDTQRTPNVHLEEEDTQRTPNVLLEEEDDHVSLFSFLILLLPYIN